MKLIINADDFGLTRGVNLGIIEACHQGVVRSATVMAGMPATEHAAELARQTPALRTGIHLRLTAGAPMASNVSSLLGDDYHLQKQAAFWANTAMVSAEIERELRAQIDSLIALGFQLTHIDGHHHCHTHPLVAPVVEQLSYEYRLPVRPCLQPVVYQNTRLSFTDKFYGDDLKVESLLDIVKAAREETDVLEVMCHPALVDEPLSQISNYSLPRTRELAILTDSDLPDELTRLGVSLADYSHISFPRT
ncbi:chitin disaccharide deacetylase [Parendozoicomonas haliclonae]|uniref:Carbohydrate deacetylase n=1 Tax=Parendozoicomonas haliclonae TaxID=1960125 RepID=A0A1X7ANS7_9GAMM|nr:chitin disaccharide deacetylase [Parendozoicomonas haliclonae]SMA49915.1 hypothetical protein EHSB41UT_03706 [Parendozoicomonas haliclonae]